MQETRVQSLGQEDPLEKRMAAHFSVLACKSPWAENPGVYSPRLQSQSDVAEHMHRANDTSWVVTMYVRLCAWPSYNALNSLKFLLKSLMAALLAVLLFVTQTPISCQKLCQNWVCSVESESSGCLQKAIVSVDTHSKTLFIQIKVTMSP